MPAAGVRRTFRYIALVFHLLSLFSSAFQNPNLKNLTNYGSPPCERFGESCEVITGEIAQLADFSWDPWFGVFLNVPNNSYYIEIRARVQRSCVTLVSTFCADSVKQLRRLVLDRNDIAVTAQLSVDCSSGTIFDSVRLQITINE